MRELTAGLGITLRRSVTTRNTAMVDEVVTAHARSLAPQGRYRVRVEATGFNAYVQEVGVSVDQETTVDLKFKSVR
jgi:hypothetical protein